MPEWNQETVEAQAAEAEKTQEQPQPEASQPEQQEQQPPKDTPEVELSKIKAALAEERALKRAEKARARAYEQELAGMREELQNLRQTLQPKPQAPDPAQQPVEAILHSNQQTQEQLRAFQETQARISQASQAQTAEIQFRGTVDALEQSFEKAQPDYRDAAKFLRDARAREYEVAGLDPDEAISRVNQEAMALAWNAIQRGQNPAEIAFSLAKSRGYVSPKQKLEMQRQGQGASMPTSSSGRGGGKLSLETIAKMSSKDFAEATKGDNWEKLLRSAE